MIIKNHLTKIALVGLIGGTFFTQLAQAYESGLGLDLGLPAVRIVALGAATPTLLIPSQQKYEKVAPPDGAVFVISSVPVIIKHEVSKNIFTANIPNDEGGYSTVIIQKSGNQFIELPVELPQLKMMVGE